MTRTADLFGQAVRHQRAGQWAEAARRCEEVLAAEPDHAPALELLGQAALAAGDAGRAESLLSRAVELRPDSASAHLHHGLALRRLGRADEALAALLRARARDPRLVEAQHQAGNLLKALGRHAEAIECLRAATSLTPKQAVLWLNLGAAQLEGGDADAAVASFRRALRIEPGRPEAHNILGHALQLTGRSGAAEASFQEALRLQPGYAPAHDNLGRLCRAAGRLHEAVAHYNAALAAQPSPATHSNLLLVLNFVPGLSPAVILDEHRRWNERYAAPLAPPRRPAPARPAGHRLRVGYLSPDFAHHSVGYFIEPVLAAHDRARCEVFCYANVAAPDRFTERMRGHAEHWRDVASLDDEAAAALIRRDDLDLLVDLAGHTARHRLLVLARRPAPVQATWIGYPNTTGNGAIDYRLTDAISDPPGETEAWHTERLARLPGPFSCYRPDDDAPAVSTLPALRGGGVTFGSLNQLAKVTPAVVTLWARVLAAVPGSRLLLKVPGRGDPQAAQRIAAAFSTAGIGPDRLELHGERLPTAAHLALYHGIDIALDPFPYNGTTTSCEALWMGVPVLTLAGRTHVARVGASLLTHLGLPDWITAGEDDYVARAVAAAADLPALAALRAGLREKMRASPLCDAPAFTRGLEQTFARLVAG